MSRVPDLQEIVDDLEAEIGRPISVEDRRWRLLAHSAQPDETDPVRQRSILTRETPPDVTAWLEGLGLHRARELVDVPENEALGMTRRGCLPLRHGDVLLGFLWVIVGDRPLSDDERAALARGAGEAADNLWARDERRERTGRCCGPRSPARALRISPPRCAGPRRRRTPSRCARAARRSPSACVGAAAPPTSRGPPTPERLVIVARDPDGLPAALAAAGATGGVSAHFGSLDDAPAALRQAEVAALCMRANPAFGPVAEYGTAGQLGPGRRAVDATPAGRSRRSGSSSSPRTVAARSCSKRSRDCSRTAATWPRRRAHCTSTERRCTAAWHASRRSRGSTSPAATTACSPTSACASTAWLRGVRPLNATSVA